MSPKSQTKNKETRRMDEYDTSEFGHLSIPQQLCLLSLHDKGLRKMHVGKSYVPCLYLAVMSEFLITEEMYIDKNSNELMFDEDSIQHFATEDDAGDEEEQQPDNVNVNNVACYKEENESEMNYFLRVLYAHYCKCRPVNFVTFVTSCVQNNVIPHIDGFIATSLTKTGAVKIKQSSILQSYRLPIMKKRVKTALKHYVVHNIKSYNPSSYSTEVSSIDKRGFALLACLVVCDPLLVKDVINKAEKNKVVQGHLKQISKDIVMNGKRDYPDSPFYHQFRPVLSRLVQH